MKLYQISEIGTTIKEDIILTRICDICGEPMKCDSIIDFPKMQIKMQYADGKFKKLDVRYRCVHRIEAFVNEKEMIQIENYNKEFKEHVKEVQIMRSEHGFIKDYKDYGFDYTPYLNRAYEDKYPELVRAQNIVNERLKDYEDYGGVRFSDVSAGGIQMTPVNNKTPISLANATIKYDFSNVDEAIDEAVRDFIKTNNEKEIKYANSFYEDGMKYGWD